MKHKKYVLPPGDRLQGMLCEDRWTGVALTPISRLGMEITTDETTFGVTAFCETGDLHGRLEERKRTDFSGSFDWLPSVGRIWTLQASDPKDRFEIITLSGVGTPRLRARIKVRDWYQIDYNSDPRGPLTCKGAMTSGSNHSVELVQTA